MGSFLVGLGECANLAQLATGAFWRSFQAGVIGEVFDQVEELGTSIFGNGAFDDCARAGTSGSEIPSRCRTR